MFEVKIQASLLASLLVRAHAPGFDSATISELHLQAEHFDYATDDAVVIASGAPGETRRQLWSVKHDVRFTAKDTVFQDVLRDAWEDFSNTDLFDPNRDLIILATGPLPSTYKHLLTLLEIIRATSSYSDFEAKLARKGFVSQEAREYFELIATLSQKLVEEKPDAAEVWKFLRCFHILGFDFDQAASKDEARIKTLLALAARAGTGGTGESLWSAIFKWVAEKNPRAGSFTYDSLPDEWKRNTISIAIHFETGVIQRLSEHSKLTLRRVHPHIGGIQLPRTEIVEGLSAAVAEEPLTLISGEAGLGKSVAAVMALQHVAEGAPVFVFQAKEFSHRHLDEAFSDMRIHESLSQISSLFGLHRRKYILIESVERLLEAPDRDAFSDLLAMLIDDPTWHVIFTCRHYASNLVKDTFLTPSKYQACHIVIPRLSLEDLDFVLSRKPDLQSIVRDDRTRYLLRNPWFLDKACSINWTGEMLETPLDQTRLREILWRQVVMRVDAQQGGLHRKRERVFQEIALGRARSMRSFVAAPVGDDDVVQVLLADELLVEDMVTGFVAPAHDVLEDWALVQWVAQVFASVGHDAPQFFEKLGHHLPIRRAYRQWLHESLDGGNLSSLRGFTDAVLFNASLSNYWRDETVVSILLSDDAPRFIADYENQLLANEKEQLKVVIHLLRLACKKPNPFLRLPEHVLAEKFGDMHLVPDGNAWNAVVKLIHRNLSQFDKRDLPYLLGLLEDWKSGINWQTPSPLGAREAGLVAVHFWNLLEDDYHWKKEFNRLLEIILSITRAIPDEFEALVRATMEDKDKHASRSYRTESIGEKLLSFFDGANACRSHPSLVAEFARKKWMLDRDLPKSRYGDWGGGTNMESHFGLPFSVHEYFLASALQGPFYTLLMSHPETGIGLIVDLINTTTIRFVKRGLDAKYGNGPIEVEIDLGDGEKRKQWVNPRLWLLYRGAMPGPNIVESALMALEKHLLELASQGHDLRDLTRNLIRQSNSVAITSIVASVAMAYPDKVGDTVLVLLKEPLFYELDQQRYIHDQSYFDIGEWGYDARKKIHHHERLESSKLAHRRQNLEGLTVRLQAGALRDQVWKIIDNFKSELETIKEQSESIKLLRLKFHRMDVRNFEAKEKLEDGSILFSSRPPDADIAEVIEKHAPALKANQEETELVVWGMSVFERKDPDKFDPFRWQEMLGKAREITCKKKDKDEFDIVSHEGGPGYVAAVCVRDHWKELGIEEKNWCREFLLAKINEHRDTRNEMLRVQRFSMASQVAAASVTSQK